MPSDDLPEAMQSGLTDPRLPLDEPLEFPNAALLRFFAPVFIDRFQLEVSPPLIRFLAFPVAYFDIYAGYRCIRTETATFDVVMFDVVKAYHLDRARKLGILLHELIHEWQEHHGKPAIFPRYHNVQFQNKARKCGLIATSRGKNVGYTETFTSILAEYGIHLAPTHAASY